MITQKQWDKAFSPVWAGIDYGEFEGSFQTEWKLTNNGIRVVDRSDPQIPSIQSYVKT